MLSRLLSLLGFLILLMSGESFSLTLAKASLEELTTESAIIVHGEITTVEYEWEDANQGAIRTLLTIDANQYLKGAEGQQIVVQQMGGKIGDIIDEVPGTPAFQIGEAVVLFLLEHQGAYHIHSIALGSFRVFMDEENTKRVLNDLRNIHLIDPVTGKEVLPEDAVTAFRFDAFINKINSYIQQK